MRLSNEYMATLKARAGGELIELLKLSYQNGSLTDALDKADPRTVDIKCELNRIAIVSLIKAIADTSGAGAAFAEFLRTTEEARLDAKDTVTLWGKAAVEEKMRELASEDFDDAIRSEYGE